MASGLQAQALGQPAPDREADLRQDPKALEAALVSLRPELLRYVHQRLDRTLKRRLDPEDVVQQALFFIVQRIAEWRANLSYHLRVWVVLQLGQTLDELRRRKLGTQRRDARRE
jgi:DNA-directed RNA polymerase specialized sigma24 family protein